MEATRAGNAKKVEARTELDAVPPRTRRDEPRPAHSTMLVAMCGALAILWAMWTFAADGNLAMYLVILAPPYALMWLCGIFFVKAAFARWFWTAASFSPIIIYYWAIDDYIGTFGGYRCANAVIGVPMFVLLATIVMTSVAAAMEKIASLAGDDGGHARKGRHSTDD